MLGYFLNLCYTLLLLIASPFIGWRMLMQGKYRAGWAEKLTGRLPVRQDCQQTRIWLHAVSVGEVLQLRQLIAEFLSQRQDLEFFITTTTDTGCVVAREQFPEQTVSFFPLDFTWAVRSAIARAQPDLVVLVELELWPNFICELQRQGIPVTLVNGRLSENSFRGYSRIRSLVQRLLQIFSIIAVQTDEYAERFLSLGASPDRVMTTGSIKFDGVETNRDTPPANALRDWLQIGDFETVWVAGSTHDPEERMVVEVYRSLRIEVPKLRLVLMPRHPERRDAISQMIRSQGFVPQLRSTRDDYVADSIAVLDTVGELRGCWGLADIAFVGGSFTSRGGQNMIEPAAYGAAVCFGVNTKNFRQIVELLCLQQAVEVVADQAALRCFVHRMATDATSRRELGQRAQSLVLQQVGATARTVSAVLAILEKDS